ncbi:MAG: hypothetical protein V5A52_07440 [Halovenus sp.]
MTGLADRSPPERIECALDAIDREDSRTTAERDAMQAFRDRISDLSVKSPTTEFSPVAVTSATDRTRAVRTVRNQYESTVMAVPHYEEEYDESYTEHVHQEFGPDVATILVHGSGFERRHKQALLAAVRESIAVREKLLETLQAERASVTALQKRVCSLARDLENIETASVADEPVQLLDGYRSRLDILKKRCHELIERRQSEMVDKRRELRLPISGPDIPTYVYSDLPVNYPVIKILTELIETAATARATLETRLSQRSQA